MRLAVLEAADQVDPRRDVPPLVAAAHLEGAPLLAIQVQVVVRLEQHVAELGVGDSGIESRLHGLLLHHHIDAEVLADITEKGYQLLLHEPVGVVQDEDARLLRVEVEQPRQLVALTAHVLPDLLLGKEGPLALLTARIANQARSPAHQHDRPVADQLKVAQQHQRHQVPDLKAGCCGIEAAVHRAATRGKMGREVPGGVVHEAAPLELGDEVGHGAESYGNALRLASAGRPY